MGFIPANKNSSTIIDEYVLTTLAPYEIDRQGCCDACTFVAVIAIRHALKNFDVKKIAVVDWDVHHGNGTETAFYNDPNVLTVSLHQDNWYPQGRGLVADTGSGAGEGFNINLPLPPGSGVGAYKAAFKRVVAPPFAPSSQI